jgi:hypothetical protein
MLSYCYAWTPFVLIGSLALLALPWLGLLALLVVALGAVLVLAGLISAILWAPVTATRAVLRRRHARIGRPELPGRALRWPRLRRRSTRSIPAGVMSLVSGRRPPRDR